MYAAILRHKPMLTDQVRMQAYQKAIHEVVKNGDVVADIGTGSGVLAFFAVQAGAKRVYAVEKDSIIEEAEKLAKDIGLGDRIAFIKGRSDGIELPERVDVIISELIGPFGIEENFLKFKMDARDRFLKEGGRLVPSWLELYLAPVESEILWKDYVCFWSSNFYGLDLSPIQTGALSQRYILDCSGKVRQLAPPSKISRINLYDIAKVPLAFNGEFIIDRRGSVHGLLGYFQIGLTENVIISTSPEKPPTHWKQTVFPLQESRMVEDGDIVSYRLVTIPYRNDLFWQWETVVRRKGCEMAKFCQSDLSIKKEEIVIHKKEFRPILTQAGEIHRKIFSLCDGDLSVEEIAKILLAEYPKEYRNLKDAFEAVVSILNGKVEIR